MCTVIVHEDTKRFFFSTMHSQEFAGCDEWVLVTSQEPMGQVQRDYKADGYLEIPNPCQQYRVSQLEVSDLGALIPCPNCGRLTYLSAELPDQSMKLPVGFTSGDARRTIYVRGQRLAVCTTCRYDVYGAW